MTEPDALESPSPEPPRHDRDRRGLDRHGLDLDHDIRPLVRRLGKAPADWRRADLVRFCAERDVRVVNLRYPSFDGKLRELRVPVNSRSYLDRLLAAGERVDGSSLFPGVFPTGRSDLYAVPVYRWAFANPFAEDELDVVCRFADADGAPAPTPDNLLADTAGRLRRETGLGLQALAELEFYLILDRGDDRFTGKAQRAYHQSAPYLHGRRVADEILRVVAAVTGGVKYCHAEVGYIDRLPSPEPELEDKRLEQYELEMELMPIEELGCWLTVSRWLVRAVAARCGASVTFAPKLDEGMAGSGMHLHLALERDGANVMMGDASSGTRYRHLSEEARRLVGGVLGRARSLTAFGNTVAASFLRLVPGQEAPTTVCWGERNRHALIRVPLAFLTDRPLDRLMNPAETGEPPAGLARPTVEYRGPDGSAFPHLLLAAVALAVEEGLTGSEALERAEGLEVDGRPAGEEALEQLPTTVVQAAAALEAERGFYEAGGFPATLVDRVLDKLRAERDEGLAGRLRDLPAAERLAESRRLMHKDLHKH